MFYPLFVPAFIAADTPMITTDIILEMKRPIQPPTVPPNPNDAANHVVDIMSITNGTANGKIDINRKKDLISYAASTALFVVFGFGFSFLTLINSKRNGDNSTTQKHADTAAIARVNNKMNCNIFIP